MDRREAERLIALVREADFMGSDAQSWVERLDPEKNALLEVVRFLVEKGQEQEAAEVATGVWRLWMMTGDPTGGREMLAAALDVGDRSPSRARALALYGDGVLAFRIGAQKESQERNESALRVARQLGDREAESLALVGLSRIAFRDGDYDRVRSLATESIELNRRLGDERMIAIEMHNLGHLEVHRGNVEAAETFFQGCAASHDADDPYERAMGHLDQASLAFARGDRDEAAGIFARVEATLDDEDVVLDPDDQYEVDWLRGML